MEMILIVAIVGICLSALTMAWATYLGWVTRNREQTAEPILESEH